MRPEIFEEVEKMSEEEKKTLLNTQFPEELEKEAAAELDTTLLADALYSYGWLQAQRSMAEVDGLDKVAAADLAAHEKAEQEAGEQIEACLASLNTAEAKDPVELHKEAQVAAALIFDGFSDCVEQSCLDKEAAAGMLGKAKSMAAKGLGKLKGAAKAGGHKAAVLGRKAGRKGLALAKKHGKGAAAGAALGAAAGGYAMSKKSSELTVGELLDIVREQQDMDDTICDGVEKLAAKGAAKGEKLNKMASKASK